MGKAEQMAFARTVQRRQARQLHKAGLIQNYGPKPVRTARELPRLASRVLRVLWRSPSRLLLWASRDLTQSRASGAHFFHGARLQPPLRGWVFTVGPRALVNLDGRRMK